MHPAHSKVAQEDEGINLKQEGSTAGEAGKT